MASGVFHSGAVTVAITVNLGEAKGYLGHSDHRPFYANHLGSVSPISLIVYQKGKTTPNSEESTRFIREPL